MHIYALQSRALAAPRCQCCTLTPVTRTVSRTRTGVKAEPACTGLSFIIDHDDSVLLPDVGPPPKMPARSETTNRDDVLAALSLHRSELESYGFVSLSLFGSLARDEADPRSDADFLVDFGEHATFDQCRRCAQ